MLALPWYTLEEKYWHSMRTQQDKKIPGVVVRILFKLFTLFFSVTSKRTLFAGKESGQLFISNKKASLTIYGAEIR